MTQWLDDQEIAAWMRLAAVVELLPGALESQLKRDSDLSHFEYWVLAMLSEAPDRTLRMSVLASRTSATLPRLSHVVQRMEDRGFVERVACPSDRRATNALLTETGWDKVVAAAPGHVEKVREQVIDLLTREQLAELTVIADRILSQLSPGAVEWIAGYERESVE
jgi:DNA-binding MarR family transcriptional regulator